MEKQNKITEDISKLIVDTNEVIETFNNQVDKINELQNKINNAIKYIESCRYEFDDKDTTNEDFDIDVYKLLEILKGSDT